MSSIIRPGTVRRQQGLRLFLPPVVRLQNSIQIFVKRPTRVVTTPIMVLSVYKRKNGKSLSKHDASTSPLLSGICQALRKVMARQRECHYQDVVFPGGRREGGGGKGKGERGGKRNGERSREKMLFSLPLSASQKKIIIYSNSSLLRVCKGLVVWPTPGEVMLLPGDSVLYRKQHERLHG